MAVKLNNIKLAKRLNITQHSIDINVSGVGLGTLAVTKTAEIQFKSRFNAFQSQIECLIGRTITQNLPLATIPPSNIVIPENIKIADLNFNIPSEIELLIGADTFWQLICVGQIRVAKNAPLFQKTYLGWILAGRVTIENSKSSDKYCNLSIMKELNENLTRFWAIEGEPEKPHQSIKGQECEALFLSTTRRNEQGRLIVTLPVKQDKLAALGSSHDIAVKRFASVERKFQRDPELKKEYVEFMREYLRLGHMRKIIDPSKETNAMPQYYMPHHAVVMPTSATTRVPVVFDASAKSDFNVSLNDALKIGPVLQDELLSTLVRFRSFQIALVADIAKMYRQVLVEESQTPLQRIVWREDPNEPLNVYELFTVTYGTASASFLAIRSLRYIAEIQSNKSLLEQRLRHAISMLTTCSQKQILLKKPELLKRKPPPH